MMEEGDEALGFEREIYWLNESSRDVARPHRPHDC